MMMADGSTSYEWQFHEDDDDVDVDDGEMSMDLESLLSILDESPPDGSPQNGSADPSLSFAPGSESTSYFGGNEHSQIHNGSLTFSPSDHSEASASRTVFSIGSSGCEKPPVNFGLTKVEAQPDAVSSMHFSSGGPGDWALPVPGGHISGAVNHRACQDVSSVNQHDTRETDFERANRNGTFGFSDSNGHHQLTDKSWISDGTYCNSVTDSCKTSETPDNLGASLTYPSGYSDIVNEPSNEFSMPYIMNTNAPYFSPSRHCHNLGLHPVINDDGMVFNVKIESEKPQMHNASSNRAMNQRPYDSDRPAKGSTSGNHLPAMFNMANKKQLGRVNDAKGDVHVATLGTGHKSFEVADDVDSAKYCGVADLLCTEKGLSQSFSGAPTSVSRKNQVVKGEQETRSSRQFISIIDRSCRSSGPLTDNHCLDVESSEQSLLHHDMSTKKQLIFTEENSMGCLPLKIGKQAVPNSTLGHVTFIDDDDDDPDICILEDMSVPARKKESPVDGKPLVTAQRSSLSAPPIHMCSNNVRLKTNDERFIYRVALQDLYQPKSEESPPVGSLSVPLLRHQRIALSWMVHKETKSMHCFGGILADDQGLGKTISTIALILKERSPSSSTHTAETKEKVTETLNLDDDDDATKAESSAMATNGSSVECRNRSMQSKSRPAAGTLVVCPTSVLRQWNDELHNKVSSKANLSVLVYHGGNRTKDPFELAKYDVVLTTYAIVGMEVPKQPLVDEDEDETRRRSDYVSVGLSSKKRKYPSSKKDKKGMDSELFESLARPLAKVRWFRVVLDEAQSIKNHRTQVARACWGLRAKRRWCLSGTPMQNAVDDLYSYFRFLRYDPYAVYKSFCSTIKAPIQRSPGSGYKKLQAILKTIMLRRTKGTLLDGEPIISLPPKTIVLKKVDFTAEERDFYCRLEADSRAQFAEYAAAGTVKQNYVNILLMLLRLRQACDHPLLVRGCSSNSEWKSSLDKAKKLPLEKRSSLLDCLEASLAICGICNDPPEDAVVTTCEHVFCNQCILEHLSSDDSQCPFSKCKVFLNASSVFSKSTLKLSIDNSPDCSLKAEVLEPCAANGSASSSSTEAAAEALDSSKIKAALEVLTSIDAASVPEKSPNTISGVGDKEDNVKGNVVLREKAIVFSQWTRMLDLLEACLKDSSIGYRRLDGTMSVTARDKAVKDFNNVPEVTVMIMSLKAASLGLNMVAACHVLLLDLWWNPTTEDQAIDRAHRIGQTRPVSVLRLTVRDTVEDRILALQQKKREMVSSAFGEDETGGSQTRLTVDDLKYLFQA